MLLLSWAFAAPEAAPDWQSALDAVIPAVVSLHVTAPRDFDTEDAGTSQGTGFVVDAARGLILTNRHMVHSGPVVAQAVFADDEEVDLIPVYRDPVHDFGFYRFDPSKVRYMTVPELKLAPEAARPGLEIRVVGNDAGEKISILDGTLARLDRNAPWYGVGYSDFNTFYYQAASNTSGGSSGSPVVDARGRVVALNAGASSEAASSFYLPLDRVVVALGHLQRGEAVPRGALPARFAFTPYPELARLGLSDAESERSRALFPSAHGMLVVESATPGAEPSENPVLRPGDIVLSVDGSPVVDFARLESVLDGAAGSAVSVVVARGAERLTLSVPVDDLHARTPQEFVEVGRGVLNDVSYIQSALRALPPRGVWVSTPGYMLSNADIPEASVITEIDGQEVNDLAAATALLAAIPDGRDFRVRWFAADTQERAYESIVEMDRRWFSMRRCRRDDATGTWPCVDLPVAEPQAPERIPPPVAPPGKADPRVRKLASALALVGFDIPYPTSGVSDLHYTGVGVVVDAGRGLMLVDRDTVAVALGDVRVRFAGARPLPASVEFLSAAHDYAVIRYDPAALDWTPASVQIAAEAPGVGDKVWLIGLDAAHEVTSVASRVDSRSALVLTPGSTPRFRDTNVEVIDLSETVETYGGLITDRRGRMVAQWASFVDHGSGDRSFHGLPNTYFSSVVRALSEGRSPAERVLGAELRPVSLSEAIERGLVQERADALRAGPRDERLVFEVDRVTTGSDAASKLRPSDFVISLDGAPLTRISQLSVAERGSGPIVLTVQRGETLRDVTIDPVSAPSEGVSRVLAWAGMLLHDPHPEVAGEHPISGDGVYVAWLWYGSPASRYGFRPTRRIVEVNGVPTPNLETLMSVVASLPDEDPVRLTLRDLDDKLEVATLRLDPHYWPTQELRRSEGRWTRVELR